MFPVFAPWYNTHISTPILPKDVAADFLALPPAAQYAAAQFIAFLRRQSQPAPANSLSPAAKQKTRKPRIPLSQELITFMWRDRPEMEESVAHIRHLRKREFRDPHA